MCVCVCVGIAGTDEENKWGLGRDGPKFVTGLPCVYYQGILQCSDGMAMAMRFM